MFFTPHLLSLIVGVSAISTKTKFKPNVSLSTGTHHVTPLASQKSQVRVDDVGAKESEPNVSQATRCLCVNQTSERVKESQRNVCACFAVCSCLRTFLDRCGLLRAILSKTV